MFLQQLLFGNYFKDEYLCLDKNSFYNGLKVFIQLNPLEKPFEVTENNILLGYKPLLLGFRFSKYFSDLRLGEIIKLTFIDQKTQKTVAFLSLEVVAEKSFGETVFLIGEGKQGKHHFLSSLHQFTNNLKEKLIKRKENNINLNPNLYEQVRIAYSIPRTIALVSVGTKESMNLFPTDLHGMVDKQIYVDSLRIKGKACNQVERTKRIVISEVEATAYKEVYSLGKNHVRDFRDSSFFNLAPQTSEVFDIVLPTQVVSYYELELFDSIDIGIHRLLFFRIINQKIISGKSSLGHIHNYYANWRKRNRFESSYFER